MWEKSHKRAVTWSHLSMVAEQRSTAMEKSISEPNERLKGDFSEKERMVTAVETLATELAQSFGSQSSERKVRQKSKTEELLAIHGTIKLPE